VVLATTMSVSDIRDRDVAPDGQTIAASSKQGRLELVGRDGRMRASIPRAGTQGRWLDDGTVIAIAGRRVTRWTARGEPLSAYDRRRCGAYVTMQP
jgi:hypothetical protein